MADKKIIGIDLGHETLKYVAVSVTADKPSIESCRANCLNLADDADGSAWREAAVNVLKSWKSENLISPEDSVYVTAPNDQVLIRTLKIKTSEIKEQLAVEADKQLPLDLKDVDWDSVVVAEENEQSYVALAAVKKQVVLDILSLMAEAGIEPNAIDCGPIAAGNVFINANSENAGAKAAILDIGATASNLTIIDGEKIWMRTFPVTGAALIGSVAKNLNISTAEARKIVNEEINLNSQAGEESAAMKNVRATITRLVMEITRSLTFYKSQLGAEKPAKLLLAGGYSNIQGLTEFLAGKLKMEVSNLNVFEGFEKPEVENPALFPEALGCALAGAGVAKYSLNLLPEDVQLQQSLNKKKVWIAATLFTFAAVFIALFVIVHLNSGSLKQTAETADAELSRISGLDSQIIKVQQQIAEKELKADEIQRLLYSRELYVNVLNEINKILPTNIWISGIESITFGDIYEQEMLENDSAGPSSIIVDENSEVYKRPVRILLRGGCYGNWIEEMPKLKEAFSKLPGISGFTQRRLTKEKKYYTFELDVDLDINNNNTADLTDIKEALAPKRRSKR